MKSGKKKKTIILIDFKFQTLKYIFLFYVILQGIMRLKKEGRFEWENTSQIIYYSQSKLASERRNF